jgi:PST family polysaccharide transporter
MFQPIANTSGWLFLTQGRSKDMFHWGLLSGPITIISIFVGLPWGAIGVATSYAFTRVLVTDPLLFWFVGRRGPVRTVDFYRTIAPFTLASLVSLGAAVLFRNVTEIHNPVVGLITLFLITGGVTLLSLSVLPTGRLALADVRKTIGLMFKQQPVLLR